MNEELVFLFIGSPSCCHRGNRDPRGRDFCGTCGGCAPPPGSSTQPALEGTPQGSVHGRVSWDGRITPCKRAPMNLSDLRQPLFQLAGLLLLPVGSRSSRVLPACTDTPRPPRAVLWEYRCSVYLPLSLRFSSHGRFILRHVVAPILPIP